MSKNTENKSRIRKIISLIAILLIEFPTVAIAWIALAEKVDSWISSDKTEILIPQKRTKTNK